MNKDKHGMQRRAESTLVASMFIFFFLFSFFACKPKQHEDIDMLNETAYNFHFKNLDSTTFYATKAYKASADYNDGKAEALNNLAFVDIIKMNYAEAYRKLDSVETLTDNQIELLVADVQFMRLCQRQSKNKDFYDYRDRAQRRMNRIDEERGTLSVHQNRRLEYARTEYSIINSTYFYYVGLTEQSAKAIQEIELDDELESDTAQMLNYLYNIGSGGIVSANSKEQIAQTEFDYLLRCYLLAMQTGYRFWEAQAMQGLSEHLQSKSTRDYLTKNNAQAILFINSDNMPDSLLAGNLAQRALEKFAEYGDVYQTAGAYRTLAECYWQIKDYPSALICLQNALDKDTAINRAPDLVASIREQFCLTYSALNDKPNSDRNRNIYLDIQEQTRQDRQLEARAGQLDRSSHQMNLMINAVVIMILLVGGMLFLFHYLRRRNDKKKSLDTFLEPLQTWKNNSEQRIAEDEQRYEELNEELMMIQMNVVKNKRRNVEQRAKVSLVNTITPFIDRILNELKHLTTKQENESIRKERYAYVVELTDKINECNDVLTRWIQMRQGEVSLRIESFPLQSLFDVVQKSRMAFQMKGITLNVVPTDAMVKADRILTLFMINTIADNARKFTPSGGTVTVSATDEQDCVEIAIADTGQGMTEQQLAHIFDHKPILDSQTSENNDGQATSHGFGLMNCKGIIDKYHKISSMFNVCSIKAESKLGEGSTFKFRLPKGVARLITLLIIMCLPFNASAKLVDKKQITDSLIASSTLLKHASAYSDSTYYSNINGTYDKTLSFADSCIYFLNKYYKEKTREGNDLMTKFSNSADQPAEIKWFRDNFKTAYRVILDMRNESAVAALALHKWDLYNYNNKVYTQLFRELSADNTLNDYVRKMKRSENNKAVAIGILVVLLIMLLLGYYLLYYRYILRYRFCIDRIHKINDTLLSNDTPENKLKLIDKAWHSRENITGKDAKMLDEVVEQIKSALRQSIEQNQQRQMNYELTEDDCRRAQLESDKLYVANSVLDNCLSTLKHETMYYPSRIKQLIDGTDVNLSVINEVAEYYKELYSLLSAQAMRQVESVKVKCQPVKLPEITEYELLGDKDMLEYLFAILKKQSGDQKLNITSEAKATRYVVLNIAMPRLKLTDEQCRNLFTSETIDLQFMLCRQIVRDIGETTNARGCGILARKDESGQVVIQLTLARKTNKNNEITKQQ